MQDLKLTDYGSVIAGTDEVKVETFIEQMKNGDGYFYKRLYRYTFDNFYFNKEQGTFEISYYQDSRKHNCSLVISDLQKELLDQGTPSDELLKLITYSEKVQYKKRQDQIVKKFYETGKLPTDPEELVIYNDILEQELKETNADIIKNRVITSIIPVLLSSSFLITAALVKNAGGDLGDILFCSGVASAMSFVASCFGFGITGTDPFPTNKIKRKMEKRDIITEKIKCLNGSEEKRIALEAERNLTPEGLKNQEVKSMANNNNIFLQALEEVKNKIAKLPEEERNQYFDDLIKIVRTYDYKVAAILDRDNNKVVLGDDANLWSVTVSMLPEVFNLEGRIDQRLLSIKEKQEIKGSLNQFEESINELKTDKGYTDGWTDDLTSGGVAYASMKDETATSRRRA